MKKSIVSKVIALVLCVLMAIPYSTVALATNTNDSPSTTNELLTTSSDKSMSSISGACTSFIGNTVVQLLNLANYTIVKNGVTKWVVSNISGKIKSKMGVSAADVAKQVDQLQQTVDKMEKQVRSNYNDLYDKIIDNELSQEKNALVNSSYRIDSYWEDYVAYCDAAKAYSDNQTDENMQILKEKADQIFFTDLNISSSVCNDGATLKLKEGSANSGANMLRNNLQILNNNISDCTSDEVSDKANETGGHSDAKHTYIKTVKEKAATTALTESQVYDVLSTELTYAASKQAKMMILYTEAMNYVSELNGAGDAETAKWMKNNFVSLYNQTINSFNNMYEQSGINTLMSSDDTVVDAYNSNYNFADKTTNYTFSRFKKYSTDSKKTNTFVVANQPVNSNVYEYTSYEQQTAINLVDLHRQYLLNRQFSKKYPYNSIYINGMQDNSSKTSVLQNYTLIGNEDYLDFIDDTQGSCFDRYILSFENSDKTPTIVDFINQYANLNINVKKSDTAKAKSILIKMPDDKQSINNYGEFVENKHIAPNLYETYTQGKWISNELSTKSNDAFKFNEYTTKELTEGNSVVWTIPMYSLNNNAQSQFVYDTNNNGGKGSGKVSTNATYSFDSGFYTPTIGSQITFTVTPSPYCQLSAIYKKTPSTEKIKNQDDQLAKELISATMEVNGDYSKPNSQTITMLAPMDYAKYDFEFQWIDLGRIFSGSGTTIDPYVIATSDDLDTYKSIKESGYPVSNYTFKTGLKGSGTTTDPYIINSDSDADVAVQLVENGIANENSVFSLKFLNGVGSSESPYSIANENQIETMIKLLDGKVNIKNYYYTPDFFEKNSKNDYVIATSDDFNLLYSLIGYNFEFKNVYFDPAYLNTAFSDSVVRDGSADNPYVMYSNIFANSILMLKKYKADTSHYYCVPYNTNGIGTKEKPYEINSDNDYKIFKSYVKIGFDYSDSYFTCSYLTGSGSESDPYVIDNTNDTTAIINKMLAINSSFIKNSYFKIKDIKGLGTTNDPYLIAGMDDFNYIKPLADINLFKDKTIKYDIAGYLGEGNGTENSPYIIRDENQFEFIKQASTTYGDIQGVDQSNLYYECSYYGAISGVGSKSDPYQIKNVDSFNEINKLCNNKISTSNKYYTVVNDIDFANSQVDNAIDFVGKLDGKNHNISNMNATNHPLFDKINSGSTVSNLQIVNPVCDSSTDKYILCNEHIGNTSKISLTSTVENGDYLYPLIGKVSSNSQAKNYEINVNGNLKNYTGICDKNYGVIYTPKVNINSSDNSNKRIENVNVIANYNKYQIKNAVVEVYCDTLNNVNGICKENGNYTSVDDMDVYRGNTKDCEITNSNITIKGKSASNTNGVCAFSVNPITFTDVDLDFTDGMFIVYGITQKNDKSSYSNIHGNYINITSPNGTNCGGGVNYNGGIITWNNINMAIDNAKNISALVNTNDGFVIFNKTNSQVKAASNFSGIALQNNKLIANNRASGAIENGINISGITNKLSGTSKIINCENLMSIGTKENAQTTKNIAGIALTVDSDNATIYNCRNDADIIGNSDDSNVIAGIIGNLTADSTVSICSNVGNIVSNNKDNTATIIANATSTNPSVDYCFSNKETKDIPLVDNSISVNDTVTNKYAKSYLLNDSFAYRLNKYVDEANKSIKPMELQFTPEYSDTIKQELIDQKLFSWGNSGDDNITIVYGECVANDISKCFTHHVKTNPTCTKDGNIEYWQSLDGSVYFKDSNCEIEIEKQDTIIPATNHKNAKRVAAKSPTSTSDGNKAYWYCPDCKLYFADKDGKIDTNKSYKDTSSFVIKKSITESTTKPSTETTTEKSTTKSTTTKTTQTTKKKVDTSKKALKQVLLIMFILCLQ